MLFKRLCKYLPGIIHLISRIVAYLMVICVTGSIAADIYAPEGHRLDLFNYKYYIASDLFNPFKNISAASYPVQIESQSDGYLLYGSENQIIKFDKNWDIAWIRKMQSNFGIMRTFSDGSILLPLPTLRSTNGEQQYVSYQILDMNGNYLSGKTYWIDQTRQARFNVVSLETDGDSVFYSGVATGEHWYSDKKYAVWKCNHSLDTIWTKQIDVSDISFINKCKSGNILVGAIDSLKKPMNILLDANGNVIWSFILDSAAITGKWVDGLELEDGSYIVVGFSDCMIIAHISNDGRLINFKQNQLVTGAYGKLMQLHNKFIFYDPGTTVEFDVTLSSLRTSQMWINDPVIPSRSFFSPFFMCRKIDSDSLICFGSYNGNYISASVGENLPPQIVWNHPTINIQPGQVYIDTIKFIDSFPGDTVRYTLINKQNAPIIFDTLSGILSCVPFSKDTGNYSIEIVARDERFQADTVQFTLVIGTDAVKTVRPKDLYSLSPTKNPTMVIHFKQEIKTNQAIDLLGREIRSIPGQAYRAKAASGVFVNKR